MKILEQTRQRLSLRDRSVGYWLGSIALMGVGLGVLPLGSKTVVECDRSPLAQPSCLVKVSGLLGHSVQPIPINTIQGATVETYRHHRRRRADRISYKVVLQTSQGTVPLGTSSSSRATKDRLATEFNTFLSTPQASLNQLHGDQRNTSFFIGLLVAGGGLFWLLRCKTYHCTVDKLRNTLSIQRRSLTNTETITHPLHTVVGTEVETRTRTNKGKTTTVGRVLLMLKSGDRIPVSENYSSNLALQNTTADTIRTYLNDTTVQVSETSGMHVTNDWNPETDPAAAIAHWRHKIHADPLDADAHFRLGMALYKQHQSQEAATMLKQARDLFERQDQPQRVIQVQDLLWRLQLE